MQNILNIIVYISFSWLIVGTAMSPKYAADIFIGPLKLMGIVATVEPETQPLEDRIIELCSKDKPTCEVMVSLFELANEEKPMTGTN